MDTLNKYLYGYHSVSNYCELVLQIDDVEPLVMSKVNKESGQTGLQ